jgi:hypothetical protein
VDEEMTGLQDYVDKLVPLQTEINAKIDEDLKQSQAIAELENEIASLISQRGVVETAAASDGISTAELTAAVMDAINAAEQPAQADAQPSEVEAEQQTEQPAAEESAPAEPVV